MYTNGQKAHENTLKILVIRKRIKIENTMNYHFTSTNMAIFF